MHNIDIEPINAKVLTGMRWHALREEGPAKLTSLFCVHELTCSQSNSAIGKEVSEGEASQYTVI
jgi:hypothetical protein